MRRPEWLRLYSSDIVARVLLAHVLGVTNSIYRKLEIANASLSTVRITGCQPKLVLLNDTSHLED